MTAPWVLILKKIWDGRFWELNRAWALNSLKYVKLLEQLLTKFEKYSYFQMKLIDSDKSSCYYLSLILVKLE